MQAAGCLSVSTHRPTRCQTIAQNMHRCLPNQDSRKCWQVHQPSIWQKENFPYPSRKQTPLPLFQDKTATCPPNKRTKTTRHLFSSLQAQPARSHPLPKTTLWQELRLKHHRYPDVQNLQDCNILLHLPQIYRN